MAQMYYEDSHLFVGQKPTYYASVGNCPGYYIGPDYGIELYQGGINFWKPHGSSNSGNYKLFLDETGRLGIGRKPTSYALEVNGQVWTTAGLLITSDGKLKQNIRNLGDSRSFYTSKLLKLNAKLYDKQVKSSAANNDEVAVMVQSGKIKQEDAAKALTELNERNKDEYKSEFGFIAQEVRELFPELVEEAKDGSLAVNYIGLIPIMLESIKELKQEVERLGNADISIRSTTASSVIDSRAEPILYQNTPNPFTEKTAIRFALPSSFNSAHIYIFNMQGALLKQIALSKGQTNIVISGSDLSAGMYLYSLIVDNREIDTKRMILTK
jgi:hypothetical protein